MSNEFYEPGEHRAERVRDLFTRIAPRYDLMNDVQSFGLHRRWKNRLIRLALPKPGELAVDLCCGTGDLTLALARHGVKACGVDFSARMLEVARARAHQLGEQKPGGNSAEAKLVFVHADVLRTPFADNSFDLVTMAYGLRNLADFTGGLREMQRLARPRGRVLVLDFGKPTNPMWHKLYFGYLWLLVPALGRIFCGSAAAYAYILESLKNYPAQEGIAAMMRNGGLRNLQIINLLGGAMSIHYAEKPG